MAKVDGPKSRVPQMVNDLKTGKLPANRETVVKILRETSADGFISTKERDALENLKNDVQLTAVGRELVSTYLKDVRTDHQKVQFERRGTRHGFYNVAVGREYRKEVNDEDVLGRLFAHLGRAIGLPQKAEYPAEFADGTVGRVVDHAMEGVGLTEDYLFEVARAVGATYIGHTGYPGYSYRGGVELLKPEVEQLYQELRATVDGDDPMWSVKNAMIGHFDRSPFSSTERTERRNQFQGPFDKLVDEMMGGHKLVGGDRLNWTYMQTLRSAFDNIVFGLDGLPHPDPLKDLKMAASGVRSSDAEHSKLFERNLFSSVRVGVSDLLVKYQNRDGIIVTHDPTNPGQPSKKEPILKGGLEGKRKQLYTDIREAFIADSSIPLDIQPQAFLDSAPIKKLLAAFEAELQALPVKS